MCELFFLVLLLFYLLQGVGFGFFFLISCLFLWAFFVYFLAV